MQTFIIHMTGDHKREANVQHLLYSLPNAQVVEAVNGREAVHAQIHPVQPGNFLRPVYPFPLSPGEIGCFLSHRRCWKNIVDKKLDYALIVEDDLAVEALSWVSTLSLVKQNATPDHFIRLPAKRREAPIEVHAQEGEAKLFTPRVIGLQTVAQIVGKNAAKRLLQASETIDRPVDTFLQMHWIHKQPIQTILPNGVSELTVELGGSTIQKRTRSNKLSREFKRLLYRSQVATHPQTAMSAAE